MKKLLFAFSLSACLTAFGQNYATGDAELNNTLAAVNTQAKTNLPGFTNRVVATYGTTPQLINSLLAGGMTPGDVIMSYEISRIVNKPVTAVLTEWKKNRSTGWGAMAKNLGIKPGSAEFHKLKSNTKSHAGAVKPPHGNAGSHGNSGTHGNGHAHGNGKGKK